MKRLFRVAALLLSLLLVLPLAMATQTLVAPKPSADDASVRLFALAFVSGDALSAVHLVRVGQTEAAITAIPANTRCQVEREDGTMLYAPLRTAYDGSEDSCVRLEEALCRFLPTGRVDGFAVISQDGLAAAVDDAGGLLISVTDIPSLALMEEYAGTSFPLATDNTSFGFALKREIEREGLTPGYDLDAGHAARSVRPSETVMLSGVQAAQAFYFTVFADPGVGTDISTIRRQGNYLLAYLSALPRQANVSALYQSGDDLLTALAADEPVFTEGGEIPPGYDRAISGTTYWVYDIASLRQWCSGH